MNPLVTERIDVNPLVAGGAVSGPATEADQLAERNWRANAAALALRHDPVLEHLRETRRGDLAWVFGRDGYLTCFEPGERWFAGCSVPLMAARAMLRPLDGSAGVACFLAPGHAAQIRVVLDRLTPAHALLCIAPDAGALGVMLRCDDFSADIAPGRLWFAAGGEWAASLSRLLTETPGLPTPTRFIRMPDADGGVIDRLIAEAQRAFADQNARRSDAIASLRDNWTPPAPADDSARRVCVIARSAFRLWDDAGHMLWSALVPNSATASAAGKALAAPNWLRFDPDQPAGCSPVALAAAAAGADLVVAADLSRGDAPRLVPERLPWITWVTTPRVPAFASAGPNDRLLLADPAWKAGALHGGWPAERVRLAGWPPRGNVPARTDDILAARRPEALALVADTASLDVPERLAEFSSHALLWEKIRRDVLRDPFAVPADIVGHIRAHAQAAGIAPKTLDLALFAEHLVVPAYQQGLAEALLAAGLPLRLHGAGWAELPRFAPHASGPITSRKSWHDAVNGAAALVHAWPISGAHPLDATGRPVVRGTGVRRQEFLQDARLALAGMIRTTQPDCPPPIAASAILDALRS